MGQGSDTLGYRACGAYIVRLPAGDSDIYLRCLGLGS